MYLSSLQTKGQLQTQFENAFASKSELYVLELNFSEIVRPKPYVLTHWGEKFVLEDLYVELAPEKVQAVSGILVKISNSNHSFMLPLKLFEQIEANIFSSSLDAYIKSVFAATDDTERLLSMTNGYGDRHFVFGFILTNDNSKMWPSQKCCRVKLNDEGEADYVLAFLESVESATAKNSEFIID